MDIIDQAYYRVYAGIYLFKNIAGYAHQLYVNGRFRGNFNSSDEYEMNELRRKIADHVRSGEHPLLGINTLRIMLGDEKIVDAFVDHNYRECYVRPNVAGWAHQLYINGRFRGNFDMKDGNDVMKIKSLLAVNIEDGNCKAKPSHIIAQLYDFQLLDEMANHQFKYCHVKPFVAGWAHQLYIQGRFRGNYDITDHFEKMQLMSKIVENIENKNCLYDPIN